MGDLSPKPGPQPAAFDLAPQQPLGQGHLAAQSTGAVQHREAVSSGGANSAIPPVKTPLRPVTGPPPPQGGRDFFAPCRSPNSPALLPWGTGPKYGRIRAAVNPAR